MDDLTISPEARDAWLLRGVIEATASPAETASDARLRAGTIFEMFKSFETVTAVEAMIACHCITLEFALMAAMRALSTTDGDEKTQTRLRNGVNALSKTLHLWMIRHETTKARREAQAAGDEAPAQGQGQVRAPKAPPPRTVAAKAPSSPPRPVPSGSVPSGLFSLPAACSLRETMLASTALAHGAMPNAMSSAMPAG